MKNGSFILGCIWGVLTVVGIKVVENMPYYKKPRTNYGGYYSSYRPYNPPSVSRYEFTHLCDEVDSLYSRIKDLEEKENDNENS